MMQEKEAIILIIGDSMALPRPGVAYTETWPYLFEKSIYQPIHVINRSRWGITTDYLIREGGDPRNAVYPAGSACLELYTPDIAIIQLGIVDCAPRLIAQGGVEGRILRRLPHSARDAYLTLTKIYRKRSASRAYVSLEIFKENVAQYTERCMRMGTRVIFVEIAPLGSQYLEKNPEGESCRKQYNDALRTQVRKSPGCCYLVNTFDASEVQLCVMEDGYHINSIGHLRVAQRLINLVQSF